MADVQTFDFRCDGPLVPPVTTESLKELDLLLIKNNLSLRIDVNYDHDLHFMPISGRRGEEKRIEAQKYWQWLELELQIHLHNSRGSCQACSEHEKTAPPHFKSRLRSMFWHLKSLILLLVPDDDHGRVKDILDVDLLVQEVQNAVLDVGSLSVWLKALLTSHCAPIRDDWAEDMASTITSASRDGDMHGLVLGLETLFSFLECMRLDVANHQIRTYRIPLIEDGVAFQIDYFEARINQRKLSVDGSKKWFQDLCRPRDDRVSHWFDDLCRPAGETERRLVKGRDVFVCGLVELCTTPAPRLPLTLKHDASRLRAIQQELHDEIHFRICRNVFRSIVSHLHSPNAQSPHRHPPKTARFSISRISDLLDGDHDHDNAVDIWRAQIDSIALDIARQAFCAVDRDDSALNADLFSQVRRVLLKSFDTESAEQTQAHLLMSQLQRTVLDQTALFDPLSPLEISEQQKHYQQARPGGSHHRRAAPDLDDISRRLAHITIIHWRVWRNLAYLDHDFCIAYGVEREDCFDGEMDLDLDIDLDLDLDGSGAGGERRNSSSSSPVPSL